MSLFIAQIWPYNICMTTLATVVPMISKTAMRDKHFETCEELGTPEIIYIRDVDWALKHWDNFLKCKGVEEMQKPHFLFIPNANDRLLFIMKWNDARDK